MKLRIYALGFTLFVTLVSLTVGQNVQAPPANSTQIADLVTANHILSNEGVLDAYGHVSVRDERDPNHFLLARSIAAGSVTASDIIVYDMDSKPLSDPQASGFIERFIHGEIYRARPDVKAVIHFHAPEVIPFTVTAIPLRPMIHMAGFLPQVMPVFEIRKTGGVTDMLIRSNELGKALAETLADKPVALLRGHGAVAVGPNLHIATGRAYYTMVNARIQLQAIALGGDKVNYMEPAEAAKAGDQDGFERGWTYWKSKVQK